MDSYKKRIATIRAYREVLDELSAQLEGTPKIRTVWEVNGYKDTADYQYHTAMTRELAPGLVRNAIQQEMTTTAMNKMWKQRALEALKSSEAPYYSRIREAKPRRATFDEAITRLRSSREWQNRLSPKKR